MIPFTSRGDVDSGKDRKDTFDPQYARCPYPVKDEYGKYDKRCTFVIPTKGEEFLRWEKEYNDPKNRKGVYGNIGVSQYIAMRHCERHYGWWKQEFGLRDTLNGEKVIRPPALTSVRAPSWEAV